MPVMKMENFKMVRLTRGIERLYDAVRAGAAMVDGLG